MQANYDAIIIGSGVGGCCTAALLAHQGKRVLLAEKRAYLGGRFSTVNRDGYMCATGGACGTGRAQYGGGLPTGGYSVWRQTLYPGSHLAGRQDIRP